MAAVYAGLTISTSSDLRSYLANRSDNDHKNLKKMSWGSAPTNAFLREKTFSENVSSSRNNVLRCAFLGLNC